MAMEGTFITMAVHHRSMTMRGTPSRSQRSTMAITGMKHGLAFEREKKEEEKKKEKKTYKYCTL